jgi:meiotically up-regulated gene 157 (Mug157) protein
VHFIAKLRPCDQDKIVEVKRSFGADLELAWMVEKYFPNTLDTTVRTAYINGKVSAIN